LQMLSADDGDVLWSRVLEGDQQSVSAYDLDGDGQFEILYTVSNPGRLYVLSHTGKVLNQWDADDWKLGNSAVIIDADGDGTLEGFLGSRSRYLIRLNMKQLVPIARRDGWGGQCGCHTSALDVDNDGRWDLFAGSGDDHAAKGVLHRYDPVSLKSAWSFKTNDNASSADPVLADIDGDGRVEVIKSVDNYAGDDAHDAVYAFETDGTVIWNVPGLSGEDSPNVADLDGDGHVEIVGMTFANEVYCLDARGKIRWRNDLRPELGLDAHAYMAPVLCDLNGDKQLEILAVTNGGYPSAGNEDADAPHGIVFALSATGEILDSFDVGGPRYGGEAFVTNVDDDPQLELVISGSGGLDVIETRGFGTNREYFQRRSNYQRLNVSPWAYQENYFIHRGHKKGVATRTDNLVLTKSKGEFAYSGTFTTELLTLPPDCEFTTLQFSADLPQGTNLTANIRDASGTFLSQHASSPATLRFAQPVQLEFVFGTTDASVTPRLDEYSLAFDRMAE